MATPLDLSLNDVLRLKRRHPCGGTDWQVTRLGADIGLRCLTCNRRVLLERPVLEKRLKQFVTHAEWAPDEGAPTREPEGTRLHSVRPEPVEGAPTREPKGTRLHLVQPESAGPNPVRPEPVEGRTRPASRTKDRAGPSRPVGRAKGARS